MMMMTMEKFIYTYSFISSNLRELQALIEYILIVFQPFSHRFLSQIEHRAEKSDDFIVVEVSGQMWKNKNLAWHNKKRTSICPNRQKAKYWSRRIWVNLDFYAKIRKQINGEYFTIFLNIARFTNLFTLIASMLFARSPPKLNSKWYSLVIRVFVCRQCRCRCRIVNERMKTAV